MIIINLKDIVMDVFMGVGIGFGNMWPWTY